MNNSGCHGNQSKKPLKIFSSQTANWIAFFFLQECSSDRDLQNSLKKKRSVKKHGFYGRLIFLLWYKVKSLKNFFSKTIYWISLFLAPLAVGQRAYVMARCPSSVRASVRPSVRPCVNFFFKHLLR